MANEKKAGTLILSQIRMFNEAKIHFEDVVEKAILDVIDKMLEMFSKDIGWLS